MVSLSTVALVFTHGMLAIALFSSLKIAVPIAPPVTQVEKVVCPKIGIPRLLETPRVMSDPAKLKSLHQAVRQRATELKSIKFQNPQNPNLLGSLPKNSRDTLTQTLKNYKHEFVLALRSQNPKAALTYLLSQDETGLLEQASSDCLPKLVTHLSGTLTLVHADDFDKKVSETRTTLLTPDNQEYILYNSEDSPVFLESSTQVEITNAFVLNQEVLVPAQGLKVLGYHQPQNPPVIGPQRVIILKTKILNQGGTERTPSTNQEILSSLYGEVDAYYQQNSYFQASVVGASGQTGSASDIYPQQGFYEISLPYRCTKNLQKVCDPLVATACGAEEGVCTASCDIHEIANAVVKVSYQEVPYANDLRLIILTNPVFPCDYGGIGTLGKISFNIPNQNQEVFMSIAGSYKANANTLAHELGHNFGLHHATYFACLAKTDLPENCPNQEYGDRFEVMGSFNGFSHSNAFHKELLGWLKTSGQSPQEIIDLTAQPHGAQVSYTLKSLSSQAPGIKALKLLHGKDQQNLYVEYRTPTDLDANILTDQLLSQYQHNIFLGALFHLGFVGGSKSGLFDAQFIDGVNNPHKPALEYTPDGTSYTDPGTGTLLKVYTPTASGMKVDVTVGRTDFTGPANIQLALAEPQTDPCAAKIRAIADDQSGISKVEFYKVNYSSSGVDPERLIVSDAVAPFEVQYDYIAMGQDLQLRVYDNAQTQGGGAENNFTIITLTAPGDYTNCNLYPEITLRSPYLTAPFSTKDVAPDFQGSRIRRYDLSSSRLTSTRSPFPIEIETESPYPVFQYFFREYQLYEEKEFNNISSETCHYFYNPTDETCIFQKAIPASNPMQYNLILDPYSPHHMRLSVVNSVEQTGIGFTTRIDFDLNVLPPLPFIRGDVYQDGKLDITDAVRILDYLFVGNVKSLDCQDAADVNDDGAVNISDATYLLGYMFSGTPTVLPAPFGTCGPDPTPNDNLGCQSFLQCGQ